MTEPSGYELEALRVGADFTLYRGRRHGNPSPLLLVAVPADRPSPQGLKRLQREYSLTAELDPAWRPCRWHSRSAKGGPSWSSRIPAARFWIGFLSGPS